MITFRTNRDQARMIQENWMSWMLASARTTMINNADILGRYYSTLIVYNLLQQTDMIFKRKLLLTARKFLFQLTDAQGAAFYVALLQVPIEQIHVYAWNFRQDLCDHIYKQLDNLRPSVCEAAPLTTVDFYGGYELEE